MKAAVSQNPAKGFAMIACEEVVLAQGGGGGYMGIFPHLECYCALAFPTTQGTLDTGTSTNV
jgi:hypothetical protein